MSSNTNKATSAADDNDEDSSPSSSFYEEEDNLKQLCDFLRSKHGPPVREATLMDKRVHFVKGTYRRLNE